MDLPKPPVPVHGLLNYIKKQELDKTEPSKLFEPYREYDAKMREMYAQRPEQLSDGDINVLSVFDGPPLKTKTRDLALEDAREKERYIMPLSDDDRHKNGSIATVASLKEFKHNFSVFTEMALSDMDWSNVVVAGSAALTPLLPYAILHHRSCR